ncbi:MAG: hypothetical protein Q8L48_07935 [Archangium sp.]|nr:hypothetical protein [Archangium sp.]
MRPLLLSIALVACSTPKEAKAPEDTTATIKPGAPTKLESQLTATSAKLNLRFEGAGENVAVTISGIEGLTVTSPAEALAGATVKAGDVKPFEVTFTGQGHLVVSVKGTFGARVHTIAIGDPQPKNDGKTLITNDGDAVKVIP